MTDNYKDNEVVIINVGTNSPLVQDDQSAEVGRLQSSCKALMVAPEHRLIFWCPLERRSRRECECVNIYIYIYIAM